MGVVVTRLIYILGKTLTCACKMALDSWLLPSTSKMGKEDSGDEQNSKMEITIVYKRCIFQYTKTQFLYYEINLGCWKLTFKSLDLTLSIVELQSVTILTFFTEIKPILLYHSYAKNK